MAELLDLSKLTADVSKAGYLERMLDRNAASYKYYWFKGILDEVCCGRREIAFTRLVARMVASAWYPVRYFRLHLGVSDKLAELVDYLSDAYALPRDVKEDAIIGAIEDAVVEDAILARMIIDRTHNVPYRLIRPFYENELRCAKDGVIASGRRWNDPMTDGAIFEANRENPNRALYVIDKSKSALLVSADWADFLRENEPVIRGWLDFRLIQYLQARNPSVPAISMKLRPPVQRKLDVATKYWKCALELTSLTEIYSGRRFTAENLEQMGSLSIDHFVPWSFVMHDEAWNLVPVFKNINSSKSDSLPLIDRYFDDFCRQQFDALIAIKQAGLATKHPKQFESYRSIDARIDEYVDSDVSQECFAGSLRSTVVPLYQIALNQGFATWEYQVVDHRDGASKRYEAVGLA